MSYSAFSRHLRLAFFCSAWVAGAFDTMAQEVAHPATLVFYPDLAVPAASEPFSLPPATNSRLVSPYLPGMDGGNLNYAPEPSENISLYQAEIRQLEDQQGMFAEPLPQLLMGMGELLQLQGNHLQAVDAFDRAMQISKIQTGLYSPGQIQLIRLQLHSLKALGFKQQIQDSLDRLVLIHQKYYGPTHTETAFAVQEVGNWKLESFVFGLQFLPGFGGVGFVNPATKVGLPPPHAPLLLDLYQAQQSFISAITTVISNQDFSEPRLAGLEDSLIATYYLNTNRGQLRRIDTSTARRYANPRTLPTDYFNGKAAYQRKLRYLSRDHKATFSQLGNTMLALADWYQLFDQYELASQQRQLLADTLHRAGLNEAEISVLMQTGSPVVLPTFLTTALSPRPFTPASAAGYIDVALQIDQWGQVSNVEIIETSAASPDRAIQELSALLNNARFRIQPTVDNPGTIRYYYEYQ